LISIAGYVHLVVFGIFIPILAIRAQKVIQWRPVVARRRYFRTMLIQVAAFAVFSMWVAQQNWIEIFPRRMPPARAILAGAVFLILAVGFGWTRWKKAVIERKRIIALFMPVDNVERVMWVFAAALAGFGEEITWRGVQTVLLTRLTGQVLIAIAIAIVMFAIAHAIQGWKSVGVIAMFAAGFHVLVWMSGSLYVAMVVHFVYDLIAGFSYAYLGKKHGYEIPGAPSAGLPEPAPAADPV
jgi:membrane protease YdiL (CAAX protease family)